MYTYSCILIHKFIYVYLFINSQSYIHARILTHVYSFINTHSRIHFIYSYHLLSFLVICDNIVYHLTTLCVHHIWTFMFTFMFNSFSFSFSIIIFMFHEHIFTFFIFYIFLVSCLLHMALRILVKYDVYEITPHSYILIPL